MAKLTAKQQRFVEEYLIDLNATQAAIRAGYSARTAAVIGEENLRKPDIKKKLNAAMAARSERTNITADRVVSELAKIGFSDIRKVALWGTHGIKTTDKEGNETVEINHGLKIIDASEIDDNTAAAISEVKEYKGAITIKMADKLGALNSIARHLGMFNDKVKINAELSVPTLNIILNKNES